MCLTFVYMCYEMFSSVQHLLVMDHPPIVNAIIDVMFNEDDMRSTAYVPDSPDVEKKVCRT